jgi:hypothetical protein
LLLALASDVFAKRATVAPAPIEVAERQVLSYPREPVEVTEVQLVSFSARSETEDIGAERLGPTGQPRS